MRSNVVRSSGCAMPSTSFHIVNLGCKVNRVEADSLAAALIAQGRLPAEEESADLIVVNTCTVTGEADKKTRKAVHHAVAVNPLADIVVTGCAAAISPDVFLAMDPRVRVVGKAELMEALGASGGAPMVRQGGGFRTRVGIKVQDGCDRACTYCIVHVARGKARSAPVEAVIREARVHFEAGVKEVVLAGIDIGAYRDGGVGLARLCELILAEADAACKTGELPARLRISSIEPISIDAALIELLAQAGGRVCRHLHIPLQSGSTKVLREMARPYTADGFRALAYRLRDRVPQMALSTDVIVGFPGETEAEFEETCAVVREAGFSRLHVFPYSRREGTPAATRPDQVAPEVKRERAARLRAIGEQLASEDLARRQGTEELCVVEGATALTESYHELPAPTGAQPGDLVQVRL